MRRDRAVLVGQRHDERVAFWVGTRRLHTREGLEKFARGTNSGIVNYELLGTIYSVCFSYVIDAFFSPIFLFRT